MVNPRCSSIEHHNFKRNKAIFYVLLFNRLHHMEEYEKRYRPVKKTLSIPGRLNDAAESAHINFSSVLQKGLKSELGMI